MNIKSEKELQGVLWRALLVVSALAMAAALAMDTHIIPSEIFGPAQPGSTTRAEIRREDGDLKTIYLAGGCFWAYSNSSISLTAS